MPYNPDQPRDERGRFAGGSNDRATGREIRRENARIRRQNKRAYRVNEALGANKPGSRVKPIPFKTYRSFNREGRLIRMTVPENDR